MSYARQGNDSDVYIFEGCGYLYCWNCVILKSDDEARNFETRSRGAMIAHMEEHLHRCELVPEQAFERLRKDAETEGDLCLEDT